MDKKLEHENQWLQAFHEFTTLEKVQPPQFLSDKILKQTHERLNPRASIIFSKLLIVHTLVGTLSLAVCDQFGVTPFRTGFSLSHYFMTFGHGFCMVLCGFLFIGLSVMTSWLFLNPDEFRLMKKRSPQHLLLLIALSFVTLKFFGAEVTWGFASLWFLGAFIGGLLPLIGLPKLLVQAEH